MLLPKLRDKDSRRKVMWVGLVFFTHSTLRWMEKHSARWKNTPLDGKTVESFVASCIFCLKIVQRTWQGGRFKMASTSKSSCSKVPFFVTLLVFLIFLFTCETTELSEAELKCIEDLIQGYKRSKFKCFQWVFYPNPSVHGSHMQ